MGNLTAELKVRLEPTMREELEQRAANAGVSVGWLMRSYAAEGLERDRLAERKATRGT